MKKFYKINQYIQADELRIIGPDNKQVGVMSRDEAIFKARQANLDLILVAEKAKPPVAKIIDFNKFKYQEQQKLKEGKKKDKTQGQKEIRLTPFIAQGDFATRIDRSKEFLTDGHKIKMTVKFTGRQITRKEFGFELLKKAVKQLAEFGTQQSEPKLQGKLLWITMAPLKQSKKVLPEKKDKKNKNEKK